MECTLCHVDAEVNKRGLCAACDIRMASVTQSIEADGGEIASILNVSMNLGEVKLAGTAPSAACSVVSEFGQSDSMRLRNPFSVCLLPHGDVLILDTPAAKKYRISQFDADGLFVRTLIECNHGSGPSELKFPKGLAVDPAGNIYVPDAGNSRIRIFDATGKNLGAIGSPGEGPGEFDYPSDIEIDETGSLYVADTGNSRIQKLTPQGIHLLSIGGETEGESGPGQDLDEPQGITVDRDKFIYVADSNNNRIVVFDAEGRFKFNFGRNGIAHGEFDGPSDVRVAPDGTIYVADRANTRVQKFSSAGNPIAEFALMVDCEIGSPGGGDIAVAENGYVLVCNPVQHTVARVQLIDA